MSYILQFILSQTVLDRKTKGKTLIYYGRNIRKVMGAGGG